jgi:hypothetical protein
VSALAASVVTAIVTAALAVAATFVTTRRNLEVQYDSELRRLRIDVYTKLWGHLDALAKYGRPEPITHRGVEELAKKLTGWYFKEGGGIFLSDATRRDYFALQDALELVRLVNGEPTPEDDEFVRVLGSRLRTGMTRDIGARKTFMLRSDVEPARELRDRQTLQTAAGQTIEVRVHRRADLGKPFRRLGGWIGRASSSEEVEIRRKDGDSWRRVTATWQSDRRGIATRGMSDASGDRLALYEGTDLLEGPTGWSRLQPPRPLTVRVWRPAKADDDGRGAPGEDRRSGPPGSGNAGG